MQHQPTLSRTLKRCNSALKRFEERCRFYLRLLKFTKYVFLCLQYRISIFLLEWINQGFDPRYSQHLLHTKSSLFLSTWTRFNAGRVLDSRGSPNLLLNLLVMVAVMMVVRLRWALSFMTCGPYTGNSAAQGPRRWSICQSSQRWSLNENSNHM